jgi:hypothetical protein
MSKPSTTKPDHIKTSSTKEAEYCVITETLLETEKQEKKKICKKTTKHSKQKLPPSRASYRPRIYANKAC